MPEFQRLTLVFCYIKVVQRCQWDLNFAGKWVQLHYDNPSKTNSVVKLGTLIEGCARAGELELI